MNTSPKLIGFLQAFGLAAYVGLFALFTQTILPILRAKFPTDPNPIVPMTLVLLAFVTSGLICATIAFCYPAYLFFHDKKEYALRVVLWSAAGLAVISALVLGGVLIF